MNIIETKNPKFTIRFATPEDASLVVEYMIKLGTYQKMADKITATKENVHKLLSENKGEAIFGDYDGETAAFIYFCHNSSAFIGQAGLYIDAFYIDKSVRSKGLGKIMMAFISKLALERGCKRVEWGCLDWNEPSINFYKELGAVSVDTMTIYRFSQDKLKENADRF
ncbi:GCN5 family acetyltransferase [Clostridium carboxidivorans P7]|uniref:GCN5-related N-acetyltransferase n=1 Tax=Clostridium carboxidivorans P7 TaxID=536227 RepID=C6PU23_9CLOT|nr:GNAT family N-acetyltransferase [Clostridium carboxidivorans]AKN33857.1 GCN5 family acetyltransferase [Clostridium carboxidivorans P7]EET87223.1 GCN5-related N-acetyltransferase [Clostridium carboxidivorans P7]EFG86529.1 acetyltransferase, GNAT family [Clostridium carboxidivorans P7]